MIRIRGPVATLRVLLLPSEPVSPSKGTREPVPSRERAENPQKVVCLGPELHRDA